MPSYTPRIPPTLDNVEDVRLYVEDEFRSIALALQEFDVAQFRVLHQEPVRLTDGLLAWADGTNWDPGSGPGLYEYRNGNWEKMAVTTELIHVRDFGLVPDTGTDQSAAVTAAIAALPARGGIIVFPAGHIKLASSINLENQSNVILRGQGKSSTLLEYTGTGDRFVNMRDTGYCWCEDLLLAASSLSFVGVLLDFSSADGESAYGGARRVSCSSFQAITTTGNITNGSPIITNIPSTTGMTVGMRVMGTGIPHANAILTVDGPTQITLYRNATATTVGVSLFVEGGKATGIALNKSIIMTVDDCYFALLNLGITGQNTSGADYSNVVTINNSTFIDNITSINGLGTAWVVTANTFQQASSGKANSIVNNSSQLTLGALISGNWFGDIGTSGGTHITLVGGLATPRGGISVIGNTFGDNGVSTAISLINVEGASICGNAFETCNVAVAFTTGASRNITIKGNVYNGVTTRYGSTGNIGVECWLEGFAANTTRFSGDIDLRSGGSLIWAGGAMQIGHNPGTDQLGFTGATGGYIFDDEITPNTDDAFDLGRVDLAWRNLFLGDTPVVGSVGEAVSSSITSGSAVALTTGVAANITSISLTAGIWDVSSAVHFNPAGTTTITSALGSVSNTSATADTSPNRFAQFAQNAAVVGANVFSVTPPNTRIELGSTTTIFLVASAAFGVSTLSAYGHIGATRVR